MGVFTDDFNRAALGSDYTTLDGTMSIDSSVNCVGADWQRSLVVLKDSVNNHDDDQTTLIRCEMASGSSRPMAGIRLSATTGYVAHFNANDIVLEKWEGSGTYTYIDNVPHGQTVSSSSVFYMFVGAVGTSITYTLYDSDSTTSLVTKTVTDASHSTGNVGFGMHNGSGNGSKLDDFTTTGAESSGGTNSNLLLMGVG